MKKIILATILTLGLSNVISVPANTINTDSKNLTSSIAKSDSQLKYYIKKCPKCGKKTAYVYTYVIECKSCGYYADLN